MGEVRPLSSEFDINDTQQLGDRAYNIAKDDGASESVDAPASTAGLSESLLSAVDDDVDELFGDDDAEEEAEAQAEDSDDEDAEAQAEDSDDKDAADVEAEAEPEDAKPPHETRTRLCLCP